MTPPAPSRHLINLVELTAAGGTAVAAVPVIAQSTVTPTDRLVLYVTLALYLSTKLSQIVLGWIKDYRALNRDSDHGKHQACLQELETVRARLTNELVVRAAENDRLKVSYETWLNAERGQNDFLHTQMERLQDANRDLLATIEGLTHANAASSEATKRATGTTRVLARKIGGSETPSGEQPVIVAPIEHVEIHPPCPPPEHPDPEP